MFFASELLSYGHVHRHFVFMLHIDIQGSKTGFLKQASFLHSLEIVVNP